MLKTNYNFSSCRQKSGFFSLFYSKQQKSCQISPKTSELLTVQINYVRFVVFCRNVANADICPRCLFIPGHTMCWFCTVWKFDFFLPLRSYMKSISVILTVQKIDISTFFCVHNFVFNYILNNFKCFNFNFHILLAISKS